MKIKHFAGYGTVNARKLKLETVDGKTTLVVEVTGDHEWGLVRRNDPYLIKHWLVERFDKTMRDDHLVNIWGLDYTVDYDWSSPVERAVYTITY